MQLKTRPSSFTHVHSIFIKVWLEIRTQLVILDPFAIKSPAEYSAGFSINDNIYKKINTSPLQSSFPFSFSCLDVSNR